MCYSDYSKEQAEQALEFLKAFQEWYEEHVELFKHAMSEIETRETKRVAESAASVGAWVDRDIERWIFSGR